MHSSRLILIFHTAKAWRRRNAKQKCGGKKTRTRERGSAVESLGDGGGLKVYGPEEPREKKEEKFVALYLNKNK